MPDPIAGLGQPQFLAALQSLLPPGPAWPRDPDAGLTKLLDGLALGLANLHARAADLTEREADPALAVELLGEWERAYGLPDPCTPLGSTLQARRAALLAKIAAQGGSTIAWFQALCDALGLAATVAEEVGTPHTWRVTLPTTTILYFRAGASQAGDHLGTPVTGQAECILLRLKPAHTDLLFSYV